MTSGWRKLQRVGEEIEHDLLNLCRISEGDELLIAAVIVVFQFSFRELRPDEALHLAENLMDHCRTDVHLDFLAAVETGEIENGADQAKEMLLALLNAAQVAQLRFVERSVDLPLEELGVTEYRLQRRPELVA